MQALDLPERMVCTAEQTAGFHDYPHNELGYEAVVFFESSFTLQINKVLMQHLAAQTPFDAYLTLRDKEGEVGELQCRQVRGAGASRGLSCSTTPPADLLLLNLDNLRFTRTAIGGWAFGTAETATGQSIFVEYGTCTGT